MISGLLETKQGFDMAAVQNAGFVFLFGIFF